MAQRRVIAGFERVKRFTSHSGHARFLAEAETIGQITRVAEIPSPYHYSPEWDVYRWNDQKVIISETSHRRFDVFVVPSTVTITGG